MKFKRLAAAAMAGILGASVLTGCAVKNDAVIATMGDVEVKAGVVNFATKLYQYYYDDFYTMYYGDAYWTTETSGTTYFDQLKTSQLETIHAYYTTYEHMGDYGVSITAEDEAKIKESAEAFIKDNSKDALKQMSGEQDIIEEYLRLVLAYSKVYDAIIADVDTNVSDEEANMRAYSFVTMSSAGYTDSNYQYVAYTDEEKTQIAAKAEGIAKLVSEGKSLEDAAKEYECEVSTNTYAADNSSLDENVKKALDALKEGETSELIKTDSAYYIVRIDKDTDEEATQKNRESIISTRQSDHFKEVLEELQKDDGWKVNEKVAAKIDFTCHFTATSETESNTQSESASQSTETETQSTETETQSTETQE